MLLMDPYAVLGVRPGSPEKEILAAYREQAKRWHPDRGAGEEAEQRMAEINAAYDLVRAAQQHEARSRGRAAPRRPRAPPARGGWLIPPLRLALGPELLDTLSEGEDVRLVTPTSTWASPRAILAVTERRLLWLLDDAPVARVHSLAFRNIAEITHKVRRKHAALTVRTLVGRRHVFHDLRPHTAATIERHVLGPTGALATVGGCAKSTQCPTSSSDATPTGTRSSSSPSPIGRTSWTPCARSRAGASTGRPRSGPRRARTPPPPTSRA